MHLVVATPGRLLDLAEHGHARLGNVSLIVMDEADKLLSEDFVNLIEKILRYTPAKTAKRKNNRQLLLYSATFPASISQFVAKHMPHGKDGDVGKEDASKEEVKYVFYFKIHSLSLSLSLCVLEGDMF